MSFKSWSAEQDVKNKDKSIETPKVGPVIELPTVPEEEAPVIELPEVKS